MRKFRRMEIATLDGEHASVLVSAHLTVMAAVTHICVKALDVPFKLRIERCGDANLYAQYEDEENAYSHGFYIGKA